MVMSKKLTDRIERLEHDALCYEALVKINNIDNLRYPPEANHKTINFGSRYYSALELAFCSFTATFYYDDDGLHCLLDNGSHKASLDCRIFNFKPFVAKYNFKRNN